MNPFGIAPTGKFQIPVARKKDQHTEIAAHILTNSMAEYGKNK